VLKQFKKCPYKYKGLDTYEYCPLCEYVWYSEYTRQIVEVDCYTHSILMTVNKHAVIYLGVL